MPQAVPINPTKLVEAARDFADHGSGGPGRPRPIWLRKATSTAYYALFHRICRDAAGHLLPNGSREAQLKLARTFGHRGLKDCCAEIAGRKGRTDPNVRPMVEALKATPIEGVAATFCDLQEARHDADYDHLAIVSKPAALGYVQDAKKVIEILEGADAHERETFYALLALRARPR